MDQPTGSTIFDDVVTTAERVGVPVVLAGCGAYALHAAPGSDMTILPWLGAALIFAALAVYVWLTARTTRNVSSSPAPDSPELVELLERVRAEMAAEKSGVHSPPARAPEGEHREA